jgi:uncharacterized membrane protein YeaQ/YmgE (transglycosylase-associated protein family)
MHILWMIVIGFLVGAIAKLLMPGKDGGGWIMTTLLGIAGSIVATYLGSALGFYAEGGAAGFVASVVGAMLLLFLYRMLKKKSS